MENNVFNKSPNQVDQNAKGWRRFFRFDIAVSAIAFSGPFLMDSLDSPIQKVLLCLSPLVGFLLLHEYMDETGLRNKLPYSFLEQKFKSAISKLLEKLIYPALPYFFKALKVLFWLIGIGIVISLAWLFFGALGSMSVSTLLIIIIVILLIK